MAIFVRNLLSSFTQDGRGCNHVIMLAELLRVAGYTLDSDDGDAGWSSNLLVNEPGGANGFAVDPTYPRQIYDPAGRFTAAMVTNEACISLLATNEQNRSMWRIVEYIDANRVLVDEWGENPDGWILETGIPGRITTQNAVTFGDDSWALLNAPSPSNLQLRVRYESYSWMRVYARPKGQAAVATETTSIAFDDYYTNRVRAQMFAEGGGSPNGIIIFINQDGERNVLGFGELDDVDSEDTDPGFIWGFDDITTQNPTQYYGPYLLDHTGAAVTAQLDFLKTRVGEQYTTRMFARWAWRTLRKEFAPMRKPNVVVPQTGGRYTRGKLPGFCALTWESFDDERPLDRAGNWYHFRYGLAFPRNGPEDPMLVRPPSS